MLISNNIRARFLYSLIGNVLRACLSFSAGVLIASHLGPAGYGNLSFLLGSFTAISNLTEMGTSSAFFTLISRKKRGRNFYIYYSVWLILQFVILISIVLFLPAIIFNIVWVDHSKELVLLSLMTSFCLNQLWRFTSHIGESIRDTFTVQLRNLLVSLFYLSTVLILVFLNLLSVRVLLIVNALLYSSGAFLYLLFLKPTNSVISSQPESFPAFFTEFKNYCLPLIPFAWMSFLLLFTDYWLLQYFGGSIQQGYYAIGTRFASLALLPTASVLQVLWKESAASRGSNQQEQPQRLYNSVSKGFFFITASLGCFLFPFSQEIIFLVLGQAYKAAWLPLALMFLYPAHQSLGQISGTILSALGKTKIIGNTGIVFMAISIPLSYFLLAPASATIPGLHLGATGLVTKTLLCQFLEVNVLSYLLCRHLDLPFKCFYQLKIMSFLMIISYVCKYSSQALLIPWFHNPYLLTIISSAILFYAIISFAVWLRPSLIGISRGELLGIKDIIIKNVLKRRE